MADQLVVEWERGVAKEVKGIIVKDKEDDFPSCKTWEWPGVHIYHLILARLPSRTSAVILLSARFPFHTS